MTSPRVYMDYNATAPLRPEVRNAVAESLDIFGNPSSVHEEGRRAKAAIERARSQVAALAGCELGEVVFTGGASEANQSIIGAGWDVIATSAMEHESVLAASQWAAEHNKCTLAVIPAGPAGMDGRVDTEWFASLKDDMARGGAELAEPLVSVQIANGETGVIQPVERIVEIAREQGYAVHTDAVQAAGKLPLDFSALDVDFMSLSAHKIGGPKGVGALIVRSGMKVRPLIRGGGQEQGRRAGTENVPGIVGFGMAAEYALQNLDSISKIKILRDRLECEVVRLAPGANIFSATQERLPNTSALALEGANAETLVIAFDLAGIAVSAGSACSSGKVARSHVLEAVGIPSELAEGTFRVSLGWDSSEQDISCFLEAWAGLVKQHQKQAVA